MREIGEWLPSVWPFPFTDLADSLRGPLAAPPAPLCAWFPSNAFASMTSGIAWLFPCEHDHVIAGAAACAIESTPFSSPLYLTAPS